MNPDLAIRIAGVLAIFAAVGHGYLGDRIIAKLKIEPVRLKSFIRCCYQFGSIGWLMGGILFLLAPHYLHGSARSVVVYSFMIVYLIAAVGNAWFTRLKHFGWVILLAVVVFSVLGI